MGRNNMSIMMSIVMWCNIMCVMDLSVMHWSGMGNFMMSWHNNMCVMMGIVVRCYMVSVMVWCNIVSIMMGCYVVSIMMHFMVWIKMISTMGNLVVKWYRMVCCLVMGHNWVVFNMMSISVMYWSMSGFVMWHTVVQS